MEQVFVVRTFAGDSSDVSGVLMPVAFREETQADAVARHMVRTLGMESAEVWRTPSLDEHPHNWELTGWFRSSPTC